MVSTMETNTAGKGNSVCWGKATEGVNSEGHTSSLKPRLEKGERVSVSLVDIPEKVPGRCKGNRLPSLLLRLTSQDVHVGKQFKATRAGGPLGLQ